MIELNKKTQQDFLNREWVQKLLEAGVDMSDAKYYISYEDSPTEDRSINCIRLKSELKDMHPDSIKIAMSMGAFERRGYINYEFDTLPTYTVSELLYKLHEWIYPTIDGREYRGPLTFLKDAPFYMFFYDLAAKPDEEGYVPVTKSKQTEYIYAEFEYPIESLASLLIQCHKKDIGMKTKDTGNISDK